ncbi:MAG: bifunctional metallophosphatase/5'-nucleotidase [Bacilli bacterium]|nr:bifunctional metallophosphatase/5'-nucleotidase [Bacilli bacterium]MBN2695959.1 bifunctional metallophosphatase/5'-nucleotidase [Bacilli bacterium]
MIEKATFQILITSDLHGHLLPINYSDNTPSSDSLANVYGLIKTFRKPEGVLLDLGDTIQGSPLMDYHRLNRTDCPNPVAVCFNKIGYDFFVIGNHDFNYGREYLDEFLGTIEAKTLCGNIFDEEYKSVFGKPYEIMELRPGLKIAIIGLTTQYIPNWERKSTTKGLVFLNAFETAEKLVKEVKNDFGVKFVIVAYHGGFEKDLDSFEPYVEDTGENLGSRILEKIEGIDVLITGHQHRKICRKVGDTTVIQPMSYGKALAVVDVDFQFVTQWETISVKSELVETIGTSPDPSLSEWLLKIEEKTQEYLDASIGFVPDDDMKIDDMFLARLNKHKVVTFINQVQMNKSGAMISCCSLGNNVTGFERNISIRNVLSTYVFPNILVVVEIDGLRLKQALEKNAEYFVWSEGKIVANPRFSHPKMEHYNYDMFDGIDYTIDVAKPFGSRIVELEYQGKAVKDSDVFTLAMNNYRATGGGEFYMYRDLKIIKEISVDITEMLIDEIRNSHEIKVVDPMNIRIINSEI